MKIGRSNLVFGFTASLIAVLVCCVLIGAAQNAFKGIFALKQRLGPEVQGQDGKISDALLQGDAQTVAMIQEVTFIRFPIHFSYGEYWLYDYIGFPKTNLTKEEVQELIGALKEIRPIWEPTLHAESKAADLKKYYETFAKYDVAFREARDKGVNGALRFTMNNGQLGFMFLGITDKVTVFETLEMPKLSGDLARPIAAIKNAAERASVQPIPALFPNDDDVKANQIAEKEFGEEYTECRNFILNSPQFKKAFGDKLSVRPALSKNEAGGLLDYYVDLTFRIVGKNGEGAAKLMLESNGVPYGEYILNGEVNTVERLSARPKISRPCAGLGMQDIDEIWAQSLDLPAATKGVVIALVINGSLAEATGFERGDILQKIDGKDIHTAKEAIGIVHSHDIGDSVPVSVLRKKQGLNLSLKVPSYEYGGSKNQVGSTLPSDEDAIRGNVDRDGAPKKLVRPWAGLMMQQVDKASVKSLGLPGKTKGVAIVKVLDGSPAQSAGFASGDIIQRIDGKDILTPDQVQDLVHLQKVGDSLNFLIRRKGRVEARSLKIGQDPNALPVEENNDFHHSGYYDSQAELTEYLSKHPYDIELHVSDSPSITSLPQLPSTLVHLQIRNCPNLTRLPQLPCSLEVLSVENCPEITSVPQLPTSLSQFYLFRCPGVKSLPDLPSSLAFLQLKNCPGITSLPKLPPTHTTIYLVIENCPGIGSVAKPYIEQDFQKRR